MRGENGDGFSDNNISWCKEGGKEGGREEDAWLARLLSLPLHHFFPLRKWLLAPTPPQTPHPRLCIYLANPFWGEREREREGERGRESRRRPSFSSVPVRSGGVFVRVSVCRPLVAHFLLLELGEGRGRRGGGELRTNAINNQQKTIVAPKGMFGSWKKWSVVEPLIRRWGKANIRHRFGKDSSQSLSKAPYSS